MGNFSPSSSHIPDAGIIKIEFLSAKGFFSPFLEKNMWMQTFLVECHISHNSRPLINSPSCQNEIVGRFPVSVHSLVVRWFPVWTPSKTHAYDVNLCGVNGLVAVHRPNLRKTTSSIWHAHSNKHQRQFTVIHPSDEQTAKHFVLSSHAISAIQPLMKEQVDKLTRMCNSMSMGRQNSPSRFHVWVV